MPDHDRKRVIAFLTRQEMEFLDKIGMDALFSTGFKLSRIDLISAVVTAVMESKVTGEGVASKDDLIKRILNGIYREIERRKFPRLKKTLNVKYRGLESMQPQKEHEVTDMSVAGLRISCTREEDLPQINQLIEVTIQDPDSKEEPVKAVKAIGRVIWVEKSPQKENFFEIGISLTYVNNKDKTTLEEFLSVRSLL